MCDRFVLLTGCSGGGKSTLLKALSNRGFATAQEPGRRIVADELAGNGMALPWTDMRAFAQRAIAMAKADLKTAHAFDGTVFFDRGVIDAAVATAQAGGPAIEKTLGTTRSYRKTEIVAPPWRDLFAKDGIRQHNFDTAVEEYVRIKRALDALGYTQVELPRVTVEERVALVLRQCGDP